MSVTEHRVGQEVASLVDGVMEADYNSISWDLSDIFLQILPSGAYLCEIVVVGDSGQKEFRDVKQMTLVELRMISSPPITPINIRYDRSSVREGKYNCRRSDRSDDLILHNR